MSAPDNTCAHCSTRHVGFAGVMVVAIAVTTGAGLGIATLLERDGRPSAAGSAVGFTVDPADFTVTPGQMVTIGIRARSGGEPINAVQSDLRYPGSLLAYSATDLDQAWNVVGPISGGSGQLSIPVASTVAVSGDVPVARASFTATAAGRVQIAVAGSSAIVSAVTSRDLLAPPNVVPPEPTSPTLPVVTPSPPPGALYPRTAAISVRITSFALSPVRFFPSRRLADGRVARRRTIASWTMTGPGKVTVSIQRKTTVKIRVTVKGKFTTRRVVRWTNLQTVRVTGKKGPNTYRFTGLVRGKRIPAGPGRIQIWTTNAKGAKVDVRSRPFTALQR